MRSTRKTILALVMMGAALSAAGVPAGASHTTTCGTSGARTPKLPNGTVDVLEPRAKHSYVFTLPAGEHRVVVWGLNGDSDIEVCKVGDPVGTHKCRSGNIANVPDTCVAPGLAGNPGAGAPLVGPGQFRLDIVHCWLEAGNSGCDYVDNPPTSVPIVYVAAWN